MSLFSIPDTEPPRARRTDPASSHTAAVESVPAHGSQCEQIHQVLMLAPLGGMTVRAIEVELTIQYGRAPQRNVIARRLCDLRQRGLTEHAPDTDDRAIRWQLTSEGRRWKA